MYINFYVEMYHRHSLLKSSEERFRYKKMTSNFGRDKGLRKGITEKNHQQIEVDSGVKHTRMSTRQETGFFYFFFFFFFFFGGGGGGWGGGSHPTGQAAGLSVMTTAVTMCVCVFVLFLVSLQKALTRKQVRNVWRIIKKKKPVYFKVELFGYAKIATITNRKTKHSSEISGLLQLTSLKPGAGEDVGTHWPYRWLAITGQPTFMMDTVSVTTKTHAALQ